MGIKCKSKEYLKGKNHNFFVLNIVSQSNLSDEKLSSLGQEFFSHWKIVKLQKYLEKKKPVVKPKPKPKKHYTHYSKPKPKPQIQTAVRPKTSTTASHTSWLDRLKQKYKNKTSSNNKTTTYNRPVSNYSAYTSAGSVLSHKLKKYELLWYKFEKKVRKWETTTFRQKRIIHVSHGIKYKVKSLYREIQQTEGDLDKDLKKYGKLKPLLDIQRKYIKLHYRAAALVGWIR